jgi:mycofactocin precursor
MRGQRETPIANDASPGAATVPAPSPDAGASAAAPEPETDVVLDELLVEDVSIDGMCGVY